MVGPRSTVLALARALFGAALAAIALSACATTEVPSVRVAKDGGIAHIGESAAGNYLAGREAGMEEDTGAAAHYFALALAADPGNSAILERAFLLDLAAGDIEPSLALAARIPPAAVSYRIARLTLSADALKKGHYQDALKAISVEDASAPSDAVWALAKAWDDVGLGKTDEALALLRADAIRKALGSFGLFHEALILDYAGRNADAEKTYAAALAASEGRSMRIVEAFGRFLEREGKTDKAVELYKAYLKLVPGHPVALAELARAQSNARAPDRLIATPAQGVAEALYGIAVVLASEHAVDLPVVYTQLALYLAPHLDPANALLGELYEQQSNWDLAMASYKKIAADSPVASLAEISIARDLAHLNRAGDAIDLLTKSPLDSVDADMTLGDLYRSQEQWQLAAQAYDKALQRLPAGDKDAWQIIYAKGISLERAGNWSEAEPLLEKALQLQPDQPQILNYLGYSWIDRGENLKQALSLIDKAVAQRPDDGYVVDSLGWAYYRLGDYRTAVYYLERAVELKADDPTINDHLGDAYWRIGRRLEAKFQWTHALDFKPDADEAAELKRKLEDGLADKPAADAASPTKAAARAAP